MSETILMTESDISVSFIESKIKKQFYFLNFEEIVLNSC